MDLFYLSQKKKGRVDKHPNSRKRETAPSYEGKKDDYLLPGRKKSPPHLQEGTRQCFIFTPREKTHLATK